MAQEGQRILPLPPEVVSQIKSSTAISSLSNVVLGLVENSLDAGAGKIEVIVNFSRGACTVEDDGVGIGPLEFAEDGGLGKPHCECWQIIPNWRPAKKGRHFETPQSFLGLRRPRHLSGFSRCVVDFDNHITPPVPYLACNPSLTPFKTSRKTPSSAYPPAIIQSQTWHESCCSRPLWQYASASQAKSCEILRRRGIRRKRYPYVEETTCSNAARMAFTRFRFAE